MIYYNREMLVPELSKVQGENSCIAKNKPAHPRWRLPEVQGGKKEKNIVRKGDVANTVPKLEAPSSPSLSINFFKSPNISPLKPPSLEKLKSGGSFFSGPRAPLQSCLR